MQYTFYFGKSQRSYMESFILKGKNKLLNFQAYIASIFFGVRI